MGIVAAGIAPHPPIIIPEIGRGEQEKAGKTVEAMHTFARRLAEVCGETLIFITPHGPMFRNTVAILAKAQLQGDFTNFSAPGVRLQTENDLDLVRTIEKESRKVGVDVALLGGKGGVASDEELCLDHGITVPLYFLQKAGTGSRCVAVTYALLPYDELYRFGQAIKKAVETLQRRVVVVASSDLSHRLIRGAPAGFTPRGEEFDRLLIEYLKSYQVEKILTMDASLIQAAGECGLRSIAVLLGCLDGETVQPELLSYEGPFGVGYPVALLTPRRKEGGDVDGEES